MFLYIKDHIKKGAKKPELYKSYIEYTHVLDEIELIHVETHPDHRNQGCASDLLQHLTNLPHKTMFLEVNEMNEIAKKLYENFHFKEYNRRADYYKPKDGPPQDAIMMRRNTKN